MREIKAQPAMRLVGKIGFPISAVAELNVARLTMKCARSRANRKRPARSRSSYERNRLSSFRRDLASFRNARQICNSPAVTEIPSGGRRHSLLQMVIRRPRLFFWDNFYSTAFRAAFPLKKPMRPSGNDKKNQSEDNNPC